MRRIAIKAIREQEKAAKKMRMEAEKRAARAAREAKRRAKMEKASKIKEIRARAKRQIELVNLGYESEAQEEEDNEPVWTIRKNLEWVLDLTNGQGIEYTVNRYGDILAVTFSKNGIYTRMTEFSDNTIMIRKTTNTYWIRPRTPDFIRRPLIGGLIWQLGADGDDVEHGIVPRDLDSPLPLENPDSPDGAYGDGYGDDHAPNYMDAPLPPEHPDSPNGADGYGYEEDYAPNYMDTPLSPDHETSSESAQNVDGVKEEEEDE